MAGSTMVPVLEVGAVEARRFVQGLPRSGSGALLGRADRTRAAADEPPVAVGGPRGRCPPAAGARDPCSGSRRALRAYGPARSPGRRRASGSSPCTTRASSVTLSPEVSRGFSGEGGVLRDLADPSSGADADLVAALLAFEPRIDIAGARRAWRRPPAGARAARPRPPRRRRPRRVRRPRRRLLPPRAALRPALCSRACTRAWLDARALVAAGAVRSTVTSRGCAAGTSSTSCGRTAGGTRCTCPWYGKHQDSRGPCKHALAVELAAKGTLAQT